MVTIAVKEMVPVVIGCMVWGHEWRGQVVHVHYDNEAVVAVINSGHSKDDQMMRCLFFVLAAWDIAIYACHIPGLLNSVADAVSCNNIPLLFAKVPEATCHPTRLPQEVIHLLVTV